MAAPKFGMKLALSPSIRMKSGTLFFLVKSKKLFNKSKITTDEKDEHRFFNKISNERLLNPFYLFSSVVKKRFFKQSLSGARAAGFVDVKGVDHVEARIRAAHGVFQADQQQPLLGAAFGDIQVVERDARFVVQDGVRDQAGNCIDQPLVHFFEEHEIQVTAEFILHDPFSELGGKQDLQALVDILGAGDKRHLGPAVGECGREAPAGA